MGDVPAISVIIATRNRAPILKKTLESFARLDLQAINTEFVVVDNNSSDTTKDVIESFLGKLPVRYLFEARPGQNSARNRALANVQLGRLVAFTDDDVEPRRDWLQVMRSASDRWPKQSVFGGKIHPLWPSADVPKWTGVKAIQGLCFTVQDYGDTEQLYPPGKLPFSPNLWVRREVFNDGRRFDTAIGPKPGNYIMGSETFFLRQLVNDGYEIVYCPSAVVGHRVQPWQISIRNVLKRAFRYGRSVAHFRLLAGKAFSTGHPVTRSIGGVAGAVWAACKFALSIVLSLSSEKRILRAIGALAALGYNVELIQRARDTTPKPK